MVEPSNPPIIKPMYVIPKDDALGEILTSTKFMVDVFRMTTKTKPKNYKFLDSYHIDWELVETAKKDVIEEYKKQGDSTFLSFGYNPINNDEVEKY